MAAYASVMTEIKLVLPNLIWKKKLLLNHVELTELPGIDRGNESQFPGLFIFQPFVFQKSEKGTT